MLTTIGIGLIVAGIVLGLVLSMWRMSERERSRWERRRGEDEDPDRFDDRGALRRHWGGWGRPGGGM